MLEIIIDEKTEIQKPISGTVQKLVSIIDTILEDVEAKKAKADSDYILDKIDKTTYMRKCWNYVSDIDHLSGKKKRMIENDRKK